MLEKVFEGLELRGQAPVAAEYLVVDDRRDGEGVEAVREGLPQLDAVPPLACSGSEKNWFRVCLI
jgi:hypothetical protein